MSGQTIEQKLEDFAKASITLTPKAISRIKNAMKMDGKEGWMLRMGVESGGCSGLNYKMTFDNQQQEMDKLIESDGLKILCDLKSWLYLKGLEIDYSDDLLNGGFRIHNPNANRTCGCGTSFSV